VIGSFGFLSEYYLNRSAFKLTDIFKEAKKANYPFIALSDGNYLYSAIKLFNNPQPYLIGLLLEVSFLDYQDSFLVYALNKNGYENLIILSSYCQLKEALIPFEVFKQYQKDLLIMTAGHKSIIYSHLHYDYRLEAKAKLSSYQENFDNFYLGLSLQTFNDEIIVAPRLKELGKELGIPLLPVNFMAYLKEDEEVYETLSELFQFDFKHDLSFLTLTELKNRYLDYPEVFSNLKAVMKLVSFKYQPEKYPLPALDKDDKTMLIKAAHQGLEKKQIPPQKLPEYQKRLTHELNVITELGYQNYFLIVADFVNYAKRNQILVGPGRGSAAGSLVSYCLNITEIDPLKHGLLFERFLNKSRRSMPDIDLDFPDDKRDEVILYVEEKYGKNHVFSINTFSRYAKKSSLRDIIKIKGYKHYQVEQISKQINSSQKLDENLATIKRIADKLDGIPRQTGTHAAGIILANKDLRFKIPLQKGPLINQTQFEFEDLERLGLLKMDFLGIRNLTIITEVLKLIKKDIKKEINLKALPLTDKKTFQLLQSGETTGLFQLESAGMRAVLKKLQPTNFNDLVALLALYRPGPMENIDLYIKRRNGAPFSYLDESLKSVLKDTYGIIVYQEQIMQIAQLFAGYSLEEADLLRVGIAKKDHEILAREKAVFIKRSVENGKAEKLAVEIYDYILKFADYGFNKSHSVSYAMIAYQMAYLKANYYLTFMQVLLSYQAVSDKATKTIINNLRKRKIEILPPAINKSTDKFEREGNSLIFPLTKIKNIGLAITTKIIEEREKGLFKNYSSFKTRMANELNTRTMEALIFSGALDQFGLNKRTLFEEQSTLIDLYKSTGLDIKEVTYPEYDQFYLREKEIEMLGFELSHSFYQIYESFFKRYQIRKLSELSFLKQQENSLAYLTEVKKITTKNGDEMAFIVLSDGVDSIDVTVFPRVYQNLKEKLVIGNVYFVSLTKITYQGEKWSLRNIKEAIL